MRLAQKVAIITGAGSGIGRTSALLFAKEGARVVTVDINAKTGLETVQRIRELGGEATFVHADVSNLSDVKTTVSTVVSRFGRIDILFNNAGIGCIGKVTDTSEEDWDRVVDVDLKGTFLMSKYCIPEMAKKGGGVIINMGSCFGLVGPRPFPTAAYSAAKGGVIQLTRAMAIDHAQDNIRVNCICPGGVDTPTNIARTRLFDEKILGYGGDPENVRKQLLEMQVMRRLGTQEEVADVAIFLASDESSFMTGAIVSVDGGYTAW